MSSKTTFDRALVSAPGFRRASYLLVEDRATLCFMHRDILRRLSLIIDRKLTRFLVENCPDDWSMSQNSCSIKAQIARHLLRIPGSVQGIAQNGVGRFLDNWA